jgi:hypothetical protein
MTDDRNKRISNGCARILMTAAALGDDTALTSEAIMEACVAVLLTTMKDDKKRVADHLRQVADVVERNTDRTRGMH